MQPSCGVFIEGGCEVAFCCEGSSSIEEPHADSASVGVCCKEDVGWEVEICENLPPSKSLLFESC